LTFEFVTRYNRHTLIKHLEYYIMTKQTNNTVKTIRLSSPLLRVLREGGKAQQSIQSTYTNALELLLVDKENIEYDSNAFTQAFDEIKTKYSIENGQDSKGNTKYKTSEEGNGLASQLRTNLRRAAKQAEAETSFTVKHSPKRGSYVEPVDWKEPKKESELVKKMKKFVETKDENLGNDIVIAVQMAILERLELEEMADELDEEHKAVCESIGKAESNMKAKRAQQAA